MIAQRAVEVTYTVHHIPSGLRYYIDFRRFLDESTGIAFRYRIQQTPKEPLSTTTGPFLMKEGMSESMIIKADMSEFLVNFTEADRAWYFERADGMLYDEMMTSTGEWRKTGPQNLRTRQRGNKNRYGLPLLIEDSTWSVPYPYRMIAEAALFDSDGFHLVALPDGDRAGFRAEFAHSYWRRIPSLRMRMPLTTSWRVILLAKNLNHLINSDLITHLSPSPEERNPGLFNFKNATDGPPDFPDYIKPGRSVWNWYMDREVSRITAEEEMEYIEAADKMGFEYATIDNGWQRWKPRSTINRVAAFARQNGMGILVWKYRKAIDDARNDYESLRTFLDYVKETGAAGVKFDFFVSELRETVEFEELVMREAAKRELLVNLHGVQKPTGETRTYPNQITREAILGMEINKISPNKIPPWHSAALTFTRFPLGPADYTPVVIQNSTRRGPTTQVHQVALLVTFTSPLQTIAESPTFLLRQKYNDIVRDIPTVWDETRAVPPSVIGSLTVLARRKDDTWFLGIVSGRMETRTIRSIPLGFLDRSKSYTATFLFTKTLRGETEEDVAVNKVARFRYKRLTNVRLWGERTKGDGLVTIFKPTDARDIS